MKKMNNLIVVLSLTLSVFAMPAFANVDNECSLMVSKILRSEKSFVQTHWGEAVYKDFIHYLNERGINQEEKNTIFKSLERIENEIDVQKVKNYIEFSLSFVGKKRLKSFEAINEIQSKETENQFVKKFIATEDKLSKKTYSSLAEKNRYTELYYSCRALSPNKQNKKAAEHFKKFSLTMGLGTLASSYAVYNMDKEKDLKWFTTLGYDIAFTVFYSVVGAKIQTKPNDTQLTKTIRNYFFGRALGTTDVFVYGPLFINERERAEERLDKLKKLENNQALQEEINKLKNYYEQRSSVRKFQDKLVYEAKRAIELTGENLDLSVAYSLTKNSEQFNWKSLTKEDLDHPVVQEMLMLAAMNEAYQLSAGEYIQTGEIGTDRYLYSSIYSLTTLPKNFYQAFWTFNILCMNQDHPAKAFTKALLMNVSANFVTNQLFYAGREKAINQ